MKDRAKPTVNCSKMGSDIGNGKLEIQNSVNESNYIYAPKRLEVNDIPIEDEGEKRKKDKWSSFDADQVLNTFGVFYYS